MGATPHTQNTPSFARRAIFREGSERSEGHSRGFTTTVQAFSGPFIELSRRTTADSVQPVPFTFVLFSSTVPLCSPFIFPPPTSLHPIAYCTLAAASILHDGFEVYKTSISPLPHPLRLGLLVALTPPCVACIGRRSAAIFSTSTTPEELLWADYWTYLVLGHQE